MFWMINCDADLDKDIKGVVTFKKAKWRSPIEAITDIEILIKEGHVYLKIKSDLNK